MELFAIGICALCAVLFAALVQKTNKEYALLISLGTAAVLLLFLLERAGPVLQQVEDLAASGPLEGEAVGLMLRAVGITVVGQVVARLWQGRGGIRPGLHRGAGRPGRGAGSGPARLGAAPEIPGRDCGPVRM